MGFLRTHDGRLVMGAAASLLLVQLVATGGDPGGGTPNPGGETPNGTTTISLVPFYLGNTRARVVIQTTAASGDTTARVPVVLSYTGEPPANVEVRAINLAASGAGVTPWTPLADMQVDTSASTVTGYLTDVPLGADYGREARVGSTVKSADTARFAVGYHIVMEGQSNMVGTLQGNLEYTSQVPGANPARSELGYWVNVGAGAFCGTDGPVAPGGISGAVGSTSMGSNSSASIGGAMSLLRIVGDHLRAKHGKTVGVCLNSNAHNNKSLDFFMEGQTYDISGKSGTTAGAIGFSSPPLYGMGDYRVRALHQGEADQNKTWEQRRDQLLQKIRREHAHVAKFGRGPAQVTILLAVLGPYWKNAKGDPAASNIEAMRRAVHEVVAYSQTQGWDVRIGWSCIDQPADDTEGLHFLGEKRFVSNRRAVQSILHALDPDGVPCSGAGPQATGEYTREGDFITMRVRHNGGTKLVLKDPAKPGTGVYANTAEDFSGEDIAVSGIEPVGSEFFRFIATGAPATFWIKLHGGRYGTEQSYYPDVTNPLMDDVTYPTGANAGDQRTGRPVHETPAALKVGL